jgi:hypothetical protein
VPQLSPGTRLKLPRVMRRPIMHSLGTLAMSLARLTPLVGLRTYRAQFFSAKWSACANNSSTQHTWAEACVTS